MTKKEAALAYARKGWKIFPCAENTKIPLAGTHGVKDATSDAEKIAEWWDANPNANVGLACGSASGVWVVDVDVRKDKGVDGFKSISASGKKLKETLSQNTPSGGMHLLYRCDGEPPANKNGFLEGVDVRGDGYYVVVSPSTINGKKYAWTEGTHEMAEFPDDFKPAQRTASVFESVPAACTVSAVPYADRARAYLAQIPGAVEHVDGHAKLFWVAQVLVNGFRLSDADALDMMWNEYNPRCVPPWTRNAKTEREFSHKVAEAHAKPNPEALSIYDAMPENAVAEEFDFDACIADVRALVMPKTPPPVSAPVSKQEALKNDLFAPEGLVGEIATWMNETAGCYQPLFSVGASIALCGAIMGRKVCDESNGRTNVFCMGVGHSSCGKDHPGDCINRILTAAGAQGVLMGRMTSDSAIEKALSVSPVKMAVLDEVGHFFSNINKAGESATYLKTIKPTLMELFSSAHKTYVGKEKASGATPVIDQPCLCMWGVTAPQKLYSGMTMEELQDGWIARNIVFISSTRPQYVMKPDSEVPVEISESVKAWLSRSAGEVVITASPGGARKPLVVPMDAEARAVFDRFSGRAHERMLEANAHGEKTEYLWGKAFQNARRIALIVACGREFENPVIAKYDADYGCRLVEYLIRDAEKAIAENVSENKWEEEKNRIRQIVDSSGMAGIARNELTRRTQWVKNSRERMAYVEDLVESGVVVVREVKTQFGRSKTVYMSFEAAKRLPAEEEVEHVDAD